MTTPTMADLDTLRTIGDPELEAALGQTWDVPTAQDYARHVSAHGLQAPTDHPRLEEAWKVALGLVETSRGSIEDLRLDMLNTARGLNNKHAPEICAALLLAALPEAYAAQWGARVLAATRQLGGTGPDDEAQLRSRIHGTITFVMQVIAPTGDMVAPTPDLDALASHLRSLEEDVASLTEDTNALTEEPVAEDLDALADDMDALVEHLGSLGEHLAARTRDGIACCQTETRGAWDDGGAALQCIAALRLLHQAIRTTQLGVRHPVRNLGPENASDGRVPVNQEDLLATRLMFVVTVFEVLMKFGLTWTEDEQCAWIYAWDLIGRCLGICDKATLRRATDAGKTFESYVSETTHPATADEARKLLWQLRDRQWSPVPSFRPECASAPPAPRLLDDLQAGRVLTHALIKELACAMPKPYRSWPLSLMRQLVPASIVRDRLGLGSSGLVLTTFGILPRRRVPVGFFTGLQIENHMNAGLLRMMGRRVAVHATIYFLKTQPAFVLPGLEQWSAPLRSRATAATSRPAAASPHPTS